MLNRLPNLKSMRTQNYCDAYQVWFQYTYNEFVNIAHTLVTGLGTSRTYEPILDYDA
jgi:hypothetical protein